MFIARRGFAAIAGITHAAANFAAFLGYHSHSEAAFREFEIVS
jgi:hypothetical protein